MLTIFVPAEEVWDESNEVFVSQPPTTVHLEHSLVSMAQWEAKYHKPFLGKAEMTNDEILDYIRFMIVDPEIPTDIFSRLSQKNFSEINEYINDSQTATWFTESNNGSKATFRGGGTITAEIVYYWMVSLNIPFECQYWHLNRLLTLIRVCNEKNQPPKKLSQRELMRRNKAQNAARRKALGTKG